MDDFKRMCKEFVDASVVPEKRMEADGLLEECFVRHDDGKFDRAFADEITPRLCACVAPDRVDGMKTVIEDLIV